MPPVYNRGEGLCAVWSLPVFSKNRKSSVPKFEHRTFQALQAALHSAGDLTRTEATGADVHMLRSTINDRLDALYIGLPGAIGAAVRVGHLDTECNALIAKFTFGHNSFNLLAGQSCSLITKHRLI